MKKTRTVFNVFYFLIGILFLNGCTGTPGPTAPLYVIAGITDDLTTTNSANSSSVLILRDRISDSLPNDAPRFERFASRPLAAQPRVFDTVEESGNRSELVVLSRSVDVNPTTSARVVSTYLDFFNTRGLTPSDDKTFRISRPRLDLKTLTYLAPLSPDTLCPIDMEVTSTGTYAVIFSSPSVCFPNSSNANEAIIVITLPAKLPGTTPASITSQILSISPNVPASPFVTTNSLTGGVNRSGMFLDQSGDTLYYLRQVGTQAVQLRSLSSSAYIQTNAETSSNNAQILRNNIPIRADEFRDMTKVGSNIAILGGSTYVLAPQAFVDTFNPVPTTTPPARSQGARAFVQDATGTRLFILDDNDRLIYHADPTNATNTVTSVEGTTSAYNTTSSFLYIAGADRINRVDTLPLGEGSTALDIVKETCNTANAAADSLCSLDNPTALTWVEGILLPNEQ